MTMTTSSAGSSAGGTDPAGETLLPRTSDQILGPFYPLGKPSLGGDLTRVAGRPGQAKGQDYTRNLINSQVVPSYDGVELPAACGLPAGEQPFKNALAPRSVSARKPVTAGPAILLPTFSITSPVFRSTLPLTSLLFHIRFFL